MKSEWVVVWFQPSDGRPRVYFAYSAARAHREGRRLIDFEGASGYRVAPRDGSYGSRSRALSMNRPTVILISITAAGLRYFINGADVTDSVAGLNLQWDKGGVPHLAITPTLPDAGSLFRRAGSVDEPL